MLNKSHLSLLALSILLVLFSGCSDRNPTDLSVSRGTINPLVFDDSYDPDVYFQAFAQTHVTAVSPDSTFAYGGYAPDGARSLKFNIAPNGSSLGLYTGGVLTSGSGRDMADFNALTFYARSNVNMTLDVAGFGNDNTGESLYEAGIGGISLNPNWTFVVVPIPDSSKLLSERGMLTFAESREMMYPQGYDVWLDEIIYANLDIITNPRPFIPSSDKQYFVGSTINIADTQTTFDVDGTDVVVNHMPGYFDYNSSDPSVAIVNDDGILITGEGETTITAQLNDIAAEGEVAITSFQPPAGIAPSPTHSADSVISLFSSDYTNVTVDSWNPHWNYSTTQNDIYKINGHDNLMYSSLNFVGVEFLTEPVDASEMTHFHADIFAPFGTNFKIKFVTFNENNGFAGQTQELVFDSESTPAFTTGEWVSLDIPLEDFTFQPSSDSPWSRIGQLVFVTDDAQLILMDNLYWHQ